MSYQQKIDLSGLKALRKESPQIVHGALDIASIKIASDARRKMTDYTPDIVDTGDLRSSVNAESNKMRIGPRGKGEKTLTDVNLGEFERAVGSSKAHAAINEFGGYIPVTARSKRFFMYMALGGWRTLKNTREGNKYRAPGPWFAMSRLPVGHRFHRNARPYIGPAFDENGDVLEKSLRTVINRTLKRLRIK